MEEYFKMSDEEKVYLKQELSKIHIDDCEEYFAQEITEFCKDDNIAEFVNISIEQDDLTVVVGENKKPLTNRIFNIELKLKKSDEIGLKTTAEDFERSLYEYLNENIYFSSQAISAKIVTYYTDGGIADTFVPDIFMMNNNSMVFKEQPELEYKAQTVAYNYCQKNENFKLQKFGITPKTNEFLIQYFVEEVYFGKKGKEYEESIENLDNICEDIKDVTLSDNAIKAYISENNLTDMRIVFVNGMINDGEMSFNIEL